MQGENGVTGLKPVITYQGVGAETGKTASFAQGQIVDAGKGEYHWAKAFSLKKLFVDYAYAFIPLGMMAWVGFGVALLMINGSYISR
ncbi:MAG: hypothetical protein V3S39_00830 [Thermodesulfobacteriota bacterium]